jgi:hypothetical protein
MQGRSVILRMAKLAAVMGQAGMLISDWLVSGMCWVLLLSILL